MKTITLLLTLFLGVITLNSFCQVSGMAFLNNNPDNSGIKIKFSPSSTTAVLDSTFTNFNGNYSISLNPGVYNISFTKTGYQDVFYDNGNLLLITGNETLNSQTLFNATIEHIIGNVNGTLFDSITYIVDGDINILSGNILTIEPGTEIKFSGFYNINVSGQLIAIGTINSRILFSSSKSSPQPGDWSFINFLNTSITSELSYSIIEYGQIFCDNSSPNITHNIVRNFQNRGIEAYTSSAYISNNEIYNFFDGNTGSGIGITSQFSNSIIECNKIFNGQGRGMTIWAGNPIVRNNEVFDMNVAFGDRVGIEVGGPSSAAMIQNNVIYGCKQGIAIEDWFQESTKPNPTIINNTVYDNDTGIDFNGSTFGSAKIKMNIIYNNINGIRGSSNNQPSEISYNLIWGNTTADYLGINTIGFGQILATNINGDPIDTYSNLFQDPQFDTNNMPYLLANNPTINAGDPSVFDSDGSIKDIGVDLTLWNCSNLSTSIKKEYISENNVNIYPNPTSSKLLINTELEISEIIIIDITGKMIMTTKQNTNIIDVTDLFNGVYFIKLITEEKTITKKFVKQ